MKIGLVLGSGAARGLAHIGVLKVLEKQKIPIDIIVGTSMGAMIGGVYAAGLKASQIEEIACETNWLRAAQILFPKKLQSKGLIDGQRVQEFLLALVGGRKIEELPIHFACIATDIWTGKEIVLNAGSMVRAIRASISFPFLFSPLEIDNHLLVDGGVVNPLPVNIAREMGADLVIAVGTMPSINRQIQHLNSGAVLPVTNLLAASGSSSFFNRFITYLDEKKSASKRKARALKKPGIRQQMVQIATTMEHMILSLRLKESPPDILITPEVDDFQFFDFNKADIIIKEGEKAAVEQMPNLNTFLKGKLSRTHE